ncbi:MAG: hypothetical protein RL215_2317, partial [Planctomycetota bacterium]
DARCQAPQTGTSVAHVAEPREERGAMHLNTPIKGLSPDDAAHRGPDNY